MNPFSGLKAVFVGPEDEHYPAPRTAVVDDAAGVVYFREDDREHALNVLKRFYIESESTCLH